MVNLVNVHDGSAKRQPIAFVATSNVGIAPNATIATPYAIHDRAMKEGYIGFFYCGADDVLLPEDIKQKLRHQLKPAIADLGGKQSQLEIMVAGTQISGLGDIIPLTKEARKVYEKLVRDAIAEVFAENFPGADMKLKFNDNPLARHCLIYVPFLNYINVVNDTDSWWP